MKVSDVMVTQVTTVAPETSLRDVARILSERRISGLPVVDAAGNVVGVVSEADFLVKERGAAAEERKGVLAWLLGNGSEEEAAKLTARTAGEAMTSPALTIDPGAPVAEAAARMIENGVNRLPVVTGGRLEGMLTRHDLVRAFTRSDVELEREIKEEILLRSLWVPPETVNVEVDGGKVTLSGELEKRTLVDILLRLVERTPGVLSVASSLSWREDDRP